MSKASSGSKGGRGGKPITQAAASRIYSATALFNSGPASSGSFPARAQSAAARRNASGKGGKPK